MIKDIFGNIRYKIGLHIHTSLSDGKVSPEESAKIYKQAGYDAIAITDHWKYYGDGELSGLKIISGCEYNSGYHDSAEDVMHIVGVGMKKAPELVKNVSTRQQIIDEINSCGGLAILAHPAWSLNSPKHALELQGIGATEIYNTVSDFGMSNRPYSGYFVDLLANEGVNYPLVATDDTHYYNGNEETTAFIMVKAPSLDTECILEAIRNKDFYASVGPEIHLHREGTKIICHCSPCEKIAFMSASSWCADRMKRGKDLTCAEYEIKDYEKWVRAEVTDKNGKTAWSNIIELN